MATVSAVKTDWNTRIKLFTMMLLTIFIWGAWQPKIFQYMAMLDFEPWQIQLGGSVFGIASIVAIFFSNQFADRSFSAERFLAASNLIGGICLIGAAYADSFAMFFAFFVSYAIVYVPTISVTNSLAFTHLKDPTNEFGFVRMGGTVGWIIASWPFIFLLSAEATVDQTKWILIVAGIASFVMAAFSLTLPHTPPRRDVASGDKLAWLKAFRLLKTPYILILYAVTLIDATIHNGYFVLVDRYLTDIGFPSNWTMPVMSLGQVAEIITMVVLGMVLKRLGWKWTMAIGIVGHAIRFAIFAFFPDAHGLIVVVQLLHGVCYAFFFATVYIFVDEVFPKDIRASAQGMFNLLILGIGVLIASFGFEWIRDQLKDSTGAVDYQTLFLIPTGLALLGTVMLAFLFNPPKEKQSESFADSAVPEGIEA